MKKSMILAAVATAGVCAQANAAALCTGAAGGGSVAFSVATSNNFVRTTFNIKCSNNVYSNYAESSTAIGVVAASAKGKNYFGGGTNNGQVTALGACTSTCGTTTEVTNANAEAMRDAS